MIYLANAYSFDSLQGHENALRTATELIKQGLMVFSPVVHNHPIAQQAGAPLGWDHWREWDLHVLDRCDELWVLMDEGEHWTRSTGVQAEIKYARATNKLVEYVGWFGGEIHKVVGHTRVKLEAKTSELAARVCARCGRTYRPTTDCCPHCEHSPGTT